MKYTLKSLLIATLLTVPVVFGSGDERLGDAQETQLPKAGSEYHDKTAPLFEAATHYPKANPYSIMGYAKVLVGLGPQYHDSAAQLFEAATQYPKVTSYDISSAAEGVAGLGPKYHETAAQLFETSAHHPKVTPFYIWFAAEGLGGLGPKYHERAAQLFETLTQHPNATSGDISFAAYGLNKLGFTERALELFSIVLACPEVDVYTKLAAQRAILQLEAFLSKQSASLVSSN